MTTVDGRSSVVVDRIADAMPKLRPVKVGNVSPHADQRPCPVWCPKEHLADEDLHSMAHAHHTLAHYWDSDESDDEIPTTNVRASLYPSDERRNAPNSIHFAHVETMLEQHGAGVPYLSLSLRAFKFKRGKGMWPDWRPDLLKLPVDEAEELPSVLMFYVNASRMESADAGGAGARA